MVRAWEIVTYHLQSSENREVEMVCDTTDETSICKETCEGSVEECSCSLGLPSAGIWRRTRVWSSQCCMLLGACELRTQISRCPHLPLHRAPSLPHKDCGKRQEEKGIPSMSSCQNSYMSSIYNLSTSAVSAYFFLWQPTSPNSINKIIS